MSSAPKNSSSTDRLPPLIYVALVGFVAWMVLAAWGFAGPGYADVALTVVTGFLALVVAIPFILWRVGRANRDGPTRSMMPASTGSARLRCRTAVRCQNARGPSARVCGVVVVTSER